MQHDSGHDTAAIDGAAGGPASFFTQLLSPDGFLPHGHCYASDPTIIALHVVSDAMIVLSYYSIPVALLYFIWRRRDIAFNWMFAMFAAFIMACGTTHLLNIVTVWEPIYRADGLLKLFTGLISLATASMLWPLIPRAVAIPTPTSLKAVNEHLAREVESRKRVEGALLRARDELEGLVDERTEALGAANASLRAEMAERHGAEDRFRSVFEHAPVGLERAAPDGRLLEVNARFCELLGYEASEALTMTYEDITDPAELPGERDIIRRLLDGEVPSYTIEKRYRRKDGSVVWGRVHCSVVRDPGGRALYRISVIEDISARREAEARLRESEGLLRFLDELGVETRTASDPGEVMEIVARRLGERLGASRCAYADVEADSERFTIRHDYTDGMPSSVGSYALSLFGDRAAGDMRSGRTLVVRDVDGELGAQGDAFRAIGIGAIITRPLVKSGRLAAMMAVHQSAARGWTAAEVALVEAVAERSWSYIERARAEAVLRESEERTRLIVDTALDAVVTIDGAGLVEGWNAQAETIFGYGREEARGRPLADLIIPTRYRAAHREGMARHARTGEGPVLNRRVELTALHRDGREFPVELAISPVPGRGAPSFSAFVRDITERRAGEEALRAGEARERARAQEVQTILDTIPVALWIAHDKDSKRITGNRFSYELLRIPPGSNASTSAPGGEAPTNFEVLEKGVRLSPEEMPVQRAAATGAPVTGSELEIRFDDGTAVYTYGDCVPLLDEAGNPRGCVAAYTDVTAIKAAQRSLQESEERFSTLADNISQLAWIAEGDGSIFWYNRRWFEFTGTDLESMRGWGWKAVHHPEHIDRVVEKFARHVREGLAWEDTFPIRGADGEYRWFLSRARPIRGEGGEVVRWFGTNTDVTEQRRLEQRDRFLVALDDAVRPLLDPGALALEATRRLGEHLAADRVVYMEVDDDGDGLTIMEGYSPELPGVAGRYRIADFGRGVHSDLLGDRVHVELDTQRETLSPSERGNFAALGILSYLAVPLRKDGRLAAAVAVHSAQPRAWSADEVDLLRLVADRCWESIERARTARRLGESEARFRQLADAMPQIIWTARPDGHIDYYNERWYEFTGFDRGLSGDGSWAPVLHPDDLARCGEAWYAAVRSGGVYQIEYRFLDRRTGGYRWFLGRAIPARDASGAVVKWYGSCTDIDDAKRAQEELGRAAETLERRVQERTAELVESNRELESFSYSVSHDLRAPVRHIGGFAELLSRHASPLLDEKARHYVTTISGAAQRAGVLIDNLLAFSRMGRAEMRSTPVDAGAMVAEAVRDLGPEIGDRRIEWSIGSLPPTHADPAMLRLVFGNLLSNAVKYTSGRQVARIEVTGEELPASGPLGGEGESDGGGDRAVPARTRYTVRDNGEGFDMRYVDKLFGVFQRLHSNEAFEGIGIGLANVRRIIGRHGGRVWGEGELGKGATFSFWLPRLDPDAAGDAAPGRVATAGPPPGTEQPA